MKGKEQLDRAVALLLNKPTTHVAEITDAFLREAARTLVEEGAVHLHGLGRLRLHVVHRRALNQPTVVRICQIHFSQAAALRRHVRQHLGPTEVIMNNERESDEGMDKFGVDEGQPDQTALEKTSAEGCPDCGGKITRHGNTLVCSNCGTKPFEKRQ